MRRCYGDVKAGDKPLLNSLTKIFSEILLEDKFPEEWVLSSLVPVYERKSDHFSRDSYKEKSYLNMFSGFSKQFCMKGFGILLTMTSCSLGLCGEGKAIYYHYLFSDKNLK